MTVGDLIEAVMHRLNRTRGCAASPGDADYLPQGQDDGTGPLIVGPITHAPEGATLGGMMTVAGVPGRSGAKVEAFAYDDAGTAKWQAGVHLPNGDIVYTDYVTTPVDLGVLDSTLAGVVLTFHAPFTEDGDDFGFTTGSYVAPLQTLVGELFRARQDSPPRIVWVPTHDSFGPPIKIGAHQRALRTRRCELEVDFWGPVSSPQTPAGDLAQAEALLDQLLVATHQEFRARHGRDGVWYEDRGVEWQTAGQITTMGCGGRLLLMFQVPVLVAPPSASSTVKIETLTLTQEVTPWQPPS